MIAMLSLHLIRMKDVLNWISKKKADMFVGDRVVYHPGGHTVGREVSGNNKLIAMVRHL